MKIPRSSHGVCYIPPYIYQIGGFTNNQKMTKSVERFNILDNSCEEVCSLNNPASSLSAVLASTPPYINSEG